MSVRAVQQQGVVLFTVADTGRGLAAEEIPHVFDPFWQARKDERRRGAGLGLPIAKGIVEAHGGRVWVESSPGKGATFFFTIPVAPWTLGGANGSNNFDFGMQAVFGGGVPVGDRVALSAAVEVPFTFVVHRTIGFTPLLGVAIRL